MTDINITSGSQYAKLLTDVLKQVEEEFPFSERMDENLFELWIEEIKNLAEESYFQYIIGKKEDYNLTNNEMDKCLEAAGLEYTHQLVNGLISEGYVESSDSDEGENIIKLSQKGKIYLQTISN